MVRSFCSHTFPGADKDVSMCSEIFSQNQLCLLYNRSFQTLIESSIKYEQFMRVSMIKNKEIENILFAIILHDDP